MQTSQRKIPTLIDAERKREGLDEVLNFASCIVGSAKFPQVSCWIAKEQVHNCIILLKTPQFTCSPYSNVNHLHFLCFRQEFSSLYTSHGVWPVAILFVMQKCDALCFTESSSVC